MNKMEFFRTLKTVMQKIAIFSIFFAFVACSFYETPELPDINRKSFSYKDVVKQRNMLEKKKTSIGLKK